METAEFLSPDQVFPDWQSACKKTMLQDIAHAVAQETGAPERDIFYGLLDREKLGCTCMGHGVALPHARVPGVKRMTAIFFRLKTPIAFDAPNSEPVDMVLALVAPTEGQQTDHLRALSSLSRLLRDREVCERLRRAIDREAVYNLLIEREEASVP